MTVSMLETSPAEAAPRLVSGAKQAALGLGLVVALGALALTALLSIAVGAKSIPLRDRARRARDYDPTNNDHLIVRSLRIPRTIVGLLVGAALGVGGAVMQGLTRNPLADPGILGVNAGAALFVVIGIYWFGQHLAARVRLVRLRRRGRSPR